MYIRKTVDEYEIQQNFGQGFECVLVEETFKEAENRLKEYRENQPEFVVRIV